MDTEHEYDEINNCSTTATTSNNLELYKCGTNAETVSAANKGRPKKCSDSKVVDISRSKIGFLCLNLVLVIIVSVLTFIAMMYITERRYEGQTGNTVLSGSQGQHRQNGDQGQKGEKGNQCQKGEKGDQGQKGEKGDQDQRVTTKSCDHGWFSFGRYCYFFEKEKKTWKDAEVINKTCRHIHFTDCKKRFGHLAKIEYAEENEHLKSKAKFLIGDAWIGGNDLVQEGQIRWVSYESRVDLGFSDWAPGEPNKDDEDCVHFWAYHSYEWNDGSCSLTFGYICKK